MNLNYIFFPAPRCNYSAQTFPNQIVWIPKQSYRKLSKSQICVKDSQIWYNKNYNSQKGSQNSRNYTNKLSTRIHFSNQIVYDSLSTDSTDINLNETQQYNGGDYDQPQIQDELIDTLVSPKSIRNYLTRQFVQKNRFNGDEFDEFATTSGKNVSRKYKINSNQAQFLKTSVSAEIQSDVMNNILQVKNNFDNQDCNYNSEDEEISQQIEARIEENDFIPCLYLRSQKRSPYIIMYFKGNGEDLQSCYELTDHIRTHLDIPLLALEYPGYGIYKGSASEQQIFKDANYVYEFLVNELKYNERNIIVMGRSIGTGPATWLAAKKIVSSLILVSPFTSLRGVVKDLVGNFAKYLIKERFDNADYMQSVYCPTLLIHGKRDQLIPYSHSITLSKVCKGICKVITPAQMNHTEFDFEDNLTTPMINFLLDNNIDIAKTIDTKIKFDRIHFIDPVYRKENIYAYKLMQQQRQQSQEQQQNQIPSLKVLNLSQSSPLAPKGYQFKDESWNLPQIEEDKSNSNMTISDENEFIWKKNL